MNLFFKSPLPAGEGVGGEGLMASFGVSRRTGPATAFADGRHRPHPSLTRHLLPSGEGRIRSVEGRGYDSRPRIPQPFQHPHRFPDRSSRPGPTVCHTPPVPLHGGLVRPATLQATGADGAGSGLKGPSTLDHRLRVRDWGQGSRGILDRSRTGRRSSLPAGGAAVRPEYGHPTQASGKPSARSVCLRRNGKL